jgi:hypothetical protein
MKRAKKRRSYAFSVWLRVAGGPWQQIVSRVWTKQPMSMRVGASK